jgi:hypothetical protein
MDTLIERVFTTTNLDPAVAKAAIGHVLLFLKDKDATGHVGDFIDKMKTAREAVDAASTSTDGGLTAAIEGMTSFMGYGRADLNILIGKLTNLGLSGAQIEALINDVVSRAETLIGAEGAARIREMLPAMAERLGGVEGLRRSA